MKIPFTNLELNISRRNISVLQEGRLVSFADWSKGFVSTANTPILEEVYNAIASETAKIDFIHCIDKPKEKEFKNRYQVLNDNLSFILNLRPNEFQSKFDFIYTMIYQLFKYGNALAFIHRDKKGNVIKLEPINVTDYEFGCGYQFVDGLTMLKYRDRKTNEIVLADYRNIIHLRLNPNNIFAGDLFSTDGNKTLIEVFDKSLHSLLNELRDSGTIRGVVKIGSGNIGYANGFANRALASQSDKVDKQQEILDRIRATKGGILVLDAGEDWQSLDSPFKTTSAKEIDEMIDIILQFNGVYKKVIDGSADSDQMEVFYNKTIAPRLDQLLSELNYKVFTKTMRTQGHKIEIQRDVFEYIPVTKAIDVIYKGVQDTTTNERRKWIYKLPPIENGDILMLNKNFAPIDEIAKGENNDE